MYLILTLVLFKLGGGVSRDFDSNPGISVNLSRDWTSLGWQVWDGGGGGGGGEERGCEL